MYVLLNLFQFDEITTSFDFVFPLTIYMYHVLSQTWSQTPEDRFSRARLIYENLGITTMITIYMYHVLSQTWSQTPEDRFSRDEPILEDFKTPCHKIGFSQI